MQESMEKQALLAAAKVLEPKGWRILGYDADTRYIVAIEDETLVHLINYRPTQDYETYKELEQASHDDVYHVAAYEETRRKFDAAYEETLRKCAELDVTVPSFEELRFQRDYMPIYMGKFNMKARFIDHPIDDED